jgi:hypothetical protein
MARTQHRSVRVADDQWEGFAQPTQRGGIIRRLMVLWTHDPDLRARVERTPDPLTKEA